MASSDVRLVIGHDDLDEYEGQTKANSWVSSKTWSQIAPPDLQSGLLTCPDCRTSPLQATANRSFHISRARALSPPLSSRANSGNNDPSVASLSSLLSGMALAHQKSQATLVAAFEQRNAALWDDIEKSIKVAEQLEGEKQRVMEENRRKGEEAERKAREMREAAEKRAREETEKEAQREEVQRKEAEDEDKRRKEEAKRVADEAKAAAAAAAAAPPPPGSVKVAAPGTAEAGSPQAEWERWNHKMIVSHLIQRATYSSLQLISLFLLFVLAAHQNCDPADSVVQPGVPVGLLRGQAGHQAQDWPAHRLSRGHVAHHQPAQRAPQPA